MSTRPVGLTWIRGQMVAYGMCQFLLISSLVLQVPAQVGRGETRKRAAQVGLTREPTPHSLLVGTPDPYLLGRRHTLSHRPWIHSSPLTQTFHKAKDRHAFQMVAFCRLGKAVWPGASVAPFCLVSLGQDVGSFPSGLRGL